MCVGVVGVGVIVKGAVVPFGFWFSLLFWLHCIPQRCIKIYFSFMAPDKGTTLTNAHCTKEFTLCESTCVCLGLCVCVCPAVPECVRVAAVPLPPPKNCN